MDPENLPKFVYLHKNHKYRLKLGFYAAPSNPKTFSKAVRDELNKLKFTYCTELNGLVMGFGKISSNEFIPADIRHCISVAVHVDVYIFRPPLGSIIEAVVNQTSENHVSCLVHNLFNVSIVRPEHQPYSQWSGSKIKKDDEINVKVLSFDLAKKLPHITGEIVENKNDECNSFKDEHKNKSTNYSSSSDESVSSLTKSIEYMKKQDPVSSSKQPLSDSESSSEMDLMRETRFKKYFDKPTNVSPQANYTTANSYSQLVKSPLSSSTPVSNSEHSVGSIDLIRTKQLKQLHKHLAKNVVNKQKSEGLVKSKKNKSFSSLDNFPIDKCDLPGVSMNNIDYSDDVSNINSPYIQSDSGISNDDHRQIKSPLQNYQLSTPKSSPKSIKKLNNSEKIVKAILNSLNPNQVKSGAKPTNTSIFSGSNTGYSNKYEDNSIYTQHMTTPDNKNDLDNSSKDTNNKCINPKKLKLSTGSVKLKNSPRKIDLEISEHENKNEVKLQSNSIFSMISDVDSSSNENIELSVPHINHEVELKKKTENNILSTLPASKKSITTDQYTSSSDDEVYTKLKQNLSKTGSAKPCEEQIENQNLLNAYCTSDSESDTSSINDTFNLKMIKSNTSPIKSVDKLLFHKHNLNNDNNVMPDKKFNEKSLPLQSSKYSNNMNDLLPNLNNNENNASEIMRQISKDSSCSDLMNQKLSSIKLTPIVSNSEEIIKPTTNNEFFNPFLKLYSTKPTNSSSSEDEAFINKLTKNDSSKESNTPLHTKGDKKSSLIQQLLTSIKYEDKKNQQKWTTRDIYSSFSKRDQKEFIKNEPKRKSKSKKDVLKCLKNPIEEPSLSSLHISPTSYPLQLQNESSIDNSTDDEINFIKNIVEKRKLNKNHELKSTLKKKNPENVSESAEPIKKLKPQKSSAINTNVLISKTTKSKTKNLGETTKLLLDTINDRKEQVSRASSIVQHDTLPNSIKVCETFKKVHKKSKSRNKSLDKTNELFNVTKTKNVKPNSSKDIILEKVLNSFDDSVSSIKNNNPIQSQSNVSSEPAEKKNKKSDPQNASTITVDESINKTIKRKKKKSIETKDFLVDSIMHLFEDYSNTEENDNSTILNKISGKKNKKSKHKNSSMIETHKLINDNMKIKQKESKKNKDLLLNHKVSSIEDASSSIQNNNSTQLDTVTKTLEKSKKSNSPIASRVGGNGTLKTKHNKFKNLCIDSITSNVDSSSQLNKLKELHGKKNKKSKLKKSAVTDDLANSTLKTKVEKSKDSKDLFLDSLIESIADSSTIDTHNKKRSRKSEDCRINSIIDLPDNIPSKKKKKDHCLITDTTNENKLKTKDSVSLSEVCKKKKKKKTESNESNLNYSTVKDNKHEYTLPVELEKKEKNNHTNKGIKNKNKIKMLPNDPIQYAIQNKKPVKIMKTNEELVNKNPKKTESVKKKLSMNNLKDFMSTQNDNFMIGLDKLYNSFNINKS